MEPRYLNLAEIYNNVETIRGNAIKNRLADMEYRNSASKMAREARRQDIFAQNIIPEKPGEMREYADYPVNNVFVPKMSGTPPAEPTNNLLYPGNVPTYRGPSTPASMNWEGARDALLKEGDVEGAMGVEDIISKKRKGAQEETKAGLDIAKAFSDLGEGERKRVAEQTGIVGSLYFGYREKYDEAISSGFSPEQAVIGIQPLYKDGLKRLTAMGIDVKTAPPQFSPEYADNVINAAQTVKDLMGQKETIRHNKAAEKKETTKGGGFGDAKDEMDLRKKISDLAFQEIAAELGVKGPRWDSLSQDWVIPPGANQEKINSMYALKVKAYYDKFGVKKVFPSKTADSPRLNAPKKSLEELIP